MSDVNKQLLEALKMVLNDPDSLDGRPRTYECVVEAIAAAEQETSSVAGWQDFNDGFKAGAEEMRDGLLQLCKDFSDRQNRPYMGDVLAQVDSLFDLIVLEIPRSLERKAEQAQQITDNTRVAWTSLGTVKAMLPELLASDDVKVRENAQIIDALVKLVGCQQQAVPDERAAFEEWLQENIDDTDTVRPSKEKVDAYFAVWLARAMLAAVPQAVAVPDGYALVPIEPTEGMLDAASQIAIDWPDGFPNHLEGYRAMLAAAPDATTIGAKCC